MKGPKTVNVHEAKTNLSKLLAEIEKGREVVVARNGKPVAKLIPFPQTRQKPQLGKGKGRYWVSDDFDAPLPDDLLDLFYK